MKEKIQKMREHIADLAKSLEENNTDAVIQSIESLNALSEEMHKSAEEAETLEKEAQEKVELEKSAYIEVWADDLKTAIKDIADAVKTGFASQTEKQENLEKKLADLEKAAPSRQDKNDSKHEEINKSEQLAKKIFG